MVWSRTDVAVGVATTPVEVGMLVGVEDVAVRLATGVSVFVAAATKVGVGEGSAKSGVTVAVAGTNVGEG